MSVTYTENTQRTYISARNCGRLHKFEGCPPSRYAPAKAIYYQEKRLFFVDSVEKRKSLRAPQRMLPVELWDRAVTHCYESGDSLYVSFVDRLGNVEFIIHRKHITPIIQGLRPSSLHPDKSPVFFLEKDMVKILRARAIDYDKI